MKRVQISATFFSVVSILISGCATPPSIPERITFGTSASAANSTIQIIDARPDRARISSKMPVAQGQRLYFSDDLMSLSAVDYIQSIAAQYTTADGKPARVELIRAEIDVFLRENSFLPKTFIAAPIIFAGGIPVPVLDRATVNKIGSFATLNAPPNSLSTDIVFRIADSRIEHRVDTNIDAALSTEELERQFRHTAEIALRKAGFTPR